MPIMKATCETCRHHDPDAEIKCTNPAGVWFGWKPADEQYCGEHQQIHPDEE